MQKFLVPALSFLLGVAVAIIIALALVIYGSSLAKRQSTLIRSHDPVPSASTGNSSSPSESTGIPSSSSPSGTVGTLQAQYARAWEFLNTGRTREAQDAFLAILSSDLEAPRAMQGLVAVRRAMVPNPTELRRQAGAYRDAVRRGADMGDHYTLSAMEALAAASERAAEEIEALSGSAPVTPPPPPKKPAPLSRALTQKDTGKDASGGTLPPSTAQPAERPHGPPAPNPSADTVKKTAETSPVAPTPRTLAPPAPVPQASPPPPPPQTAPSLPSAAPAPQTPPPVPAVAPKTPSPLPGANASLYVVRVGPISNRDEASALEKELSSKGFSSAKLTMQRGVLFQVASEPLPRSVAENLAAMLAVRGLHSRVEPPTGDTTHLVFGAFTSQNEAEALVRRINAQGYDAWVTREGAAYTLELGPYPQTSVEAITGIIKSSSPEATITVDLVAVLPPPAVAQQTPTPPPVAAPQTPAPPPGASARLYVVRAGPISNQDEASALEKELSSKGFWSAKMIVLRGVLFQVVSEPLPRSVAENLAAMLAGRSLHSRVEPPTGDTAQLVFGVFTSQNEAEALVRRINAQGYDAWITREGAAYTLELGPYPQTSVEAITGIIKSSAPDAGVTVVPVSPSTSPHPVPQAPPPPPSAGDSRKTK